MAEERLDLARLFQQVMGLSPKFHARIVRFRHVLNCLLQQPAVEWTEIVASGGYYDQPHLVKEFVAFTGFSPEAYRARYIWWIFSSAKSGPIFTRQLRTTVLP